MSLFHSILSQLQEKISKETTQYETIATILTEQLGTTITKEQISFQKNTLRIKANPTVKMAIMMKQKYLLAALQQAGISIKTIA